MGGEGGEGRRGRGGGLGVGACNTFRGQTELGGRQKPVYSANLNRLPKDCYCL